ncbi:uncharacterized protein C1orf198 homolog isoform 3-T3 [Hipposideros larvatus]
MAVTTSNPVKLPGADLGTRQPPSELAKGSLEKWGAPREPTWADPYDSRSRGTSQRGEDITWQDEHSAPFSWETRSQMEFSISSLSIHEPSSGSTSESRPPSKASQGLQALRPSQGSKPSNPDALGPGQQEEEASFWKINAERSRGEGPQAEFQSLTPSQIKSMEKGEKVLPVCYRQDPAPKDREAKAERPSHLRQEPRVLPGASVEREGPQPVQACTSTLEEATRSEPVSKLPSPGAGPGDREDMEDALFSEPAPAQVGSSNVILKTGFDFLDNW